MRIRRTLAIALGSVLVLALAAAIPLLVATPPSAAGDDDAPLLPQELVMDLYEECYVPWPETPDVFPFPLPEPDGRLVLVLASVDQQSGELVYLEPTAEQAALMDGMNECFARWPVDQTWKGPPQFEGSQARLYSDYVARVLTPCLRTQGLEVIELRVPIHTVDMLAWYFRQIEPLDLEQSVAIWRACPLVPGYLEAEAYPEQVDFEVFG